MVDILESDKIKLKILKILSNRKVYSFYHLSKVLKTNYSTVKKNCFFLELLKLVEVIKIEKEESASNKPTYRVKITERGLDVIKDLNDHEKSVF